MTVKNERVQIAKSFESILSLTFVPIVYERALAQTNRLTQALSICLFYQTLHERLNPGKVPKDIFQILVIKDHKLCGLLTTDRVSRLIKELGITNTRIIPARHRNIDYNNLIELLIIEGILTTDIYKSMLEHYDELSEFVAAELAAR